MVGFPSVAKEEMAGEDKSERGCLAHRGQKNGGEKKKKNAEENHGHHAKFLTVATVLALPWDPTRSFRPFKPLNCTTDCVDKRGTVLHIPSLCMGCLVSIFQFQCDWN